jgi:hypothetical protein
MKSFDVGRLAELTESDLVSLDNTDDSSSSASSTAAVSTPMPTATNSFSLFSSAISSSTSLIHDPLASLGVLGDLTSASGPLSFTPFQQPHHPFVGAATASAGADFTLDYSTPEVREMLDSEWLAADLLNVS